jgi:hypothetical protein
VVPGINGLGQPLDNVAVVMADLLIELGILDADGCLVGQDGEQGQVALGEGPSPVKLTRLRRPMDF